MKLLAFLIFTFCSGAYATDIQLIWTKPTLRVDGTTIQVIDEYRLYHSIDNVSVPILSIVSGATDYLFNDAVNGIHTFQISTVEAQQEGALSDPISVSVELSAPSRMVFEVIVIRK